MTRRLVGVDAPKIEIKNTTPAPASPDLAASEQQWQQAAANNVAAYQEQFRGIQAQMQEISGKQQKVANQAQSGGTLASIFEGLNKGLEIYSSISQAREQENQQKKREYTEQQALFEEQQKEIQEGNYSDLLGGLNQSLLSVQQTLMNSFDEQGALTVYRQLDQQIESANISDEQKQQSRRFLFDTFQSYQGRSLTRQQEVRDKYQAQLADNLVAEFNFAISEERQYAANDRNQAPAAMQNAATKFDMAMRQVHQLNLPENVVLSIRAQMLQPLIEMANDSNEAAVIYNFTARKYAEADAAVSQINQRAQAEGWSEERRQQAIQRVRLEATGSRDLVDVSAADNLNLALTQAQQQRQLLQLQTPDAPRLAQEQMLPVIQDILLGRRSLDEFKQPGLESQYNQLKAAIDAYNENYPLIERLNAQRIAPLSSLNEATAQLQELQDIISQGDVAIERQIAQGRFKNREEMQSEIIKLQSRAQQAQQEIDNIDRQLGNAGNILSQFRLNQGLPGLMNYLASPEGQQAQAQVAQALAAQQTFAGSASNFPTSQRDSTQTRRTPVAGIQVVGGDNPTGIPSPRSPFRTSQLQPGQVHITATIKAGSHEDGNALDFAAPGGTSVEVGAMTSGTVVDIQNGCRVGDRGCGNGYGNLVVIRDRQGRHWMYAHNDRNTVRLGDTVSQGQLIGYQGNTGSSSGDHVHVEVWDGAPGWLGGNGQPLHYSNWLPSIKPEQDTTTATQGVPGMGFDANQQPYRGADVPQRRALTLPSNGVVLPSAMLYSNGNMLLPTAQHNDTRMSSNQMPNPQAGVPSSRLFSTARPMTGQTATPNNSGYQGRNRANPAANYGYTYLRDNAPVRAKIAQIATRLNVPAQWVADTIALATGGTFNPATFTNNRGGIGMFTESFLQSQGTNMNAVRQMPMTQQLDLFYRMLAGSNDEYVGRYNRVEFMVMAVLSGGDKTKAFARPDGWDNDRAGAYGVWDILRTLGSHAGRRYTTYADVFDPADLVQDQPNTPFGQSLAAAGGTAPRWTGDGLSVAAQELDPRMKAFLDLIARVEGGWHENSYRQIVGGGFINSFADHPNRNSSTNATGRYQFIGTTWAGYANGGDFSPASQDRAAARLIQSHGIWRRIESGDVEGAIYAAAPTWRGLPQGRDNLTYQDQYAGYNRAGITWQDALKFYQERLRYYTGGTPPRRE